MMLADEPIASLDPLNAKIVMDSLRDINEREGITVITNLHTLDTARSYCERIIGMAGGKVVFDGKPSELTADAVNEIYGTDKNGAGIDETMTSTSLDNIKGKQDAVSRVMAASAVMR
jgi:phosphonate transport system ATP-binding protein